MNFLSCSRQMLTGRFLILFPPRTKSDKGGNRSVVTSFPCSYFQRTPNNKITISRRRSWCKFSNESIVPKPSYLAHAKQRLTQLQCPHCMVQTHQVKSRIYKSLFGSWKFTMKRSPLRSSFLFCAQKSVCCRYFHSVLQLVIRQQMKLSHCVI